MTIDARNRQLPDWLHRIRLRQTVLPRFQRFEAWNHVNVTQMFNTILRELPIGALLVLEVGEKELFISRPIEGAPNDGERITENLLDGQQRLTALWRGLNNDYDDRTYFAYLAEDEDTNMPFFINSIARWKQTSDKARRPFWANKPKDQWARRAIPLHLCSPGDDTQEKYKKWAKEAIPDSDEREEVNDIHNKIRQKISSYNLPFLSLPVSTSKETALDVFIKMNTTAAPLKIYDIVVAQVEASLGKSLHDLVSASKVACPNISHYYDPEELVLYVSALLQRKPPTNKTYLDKGFGVKLLEHWDEIIYGITKAAVFLEEERVFDSKRLPTDLVVPILAALWAKAPVGKDAEGRSRIIFRKYLWRAFFSNRYERSTNSRALNDYISISSLINGDMSDRPLIFDQNQHPLPEESEIMAAGWPKNKDRLSRAILALALKEGGIDLADGSEVNRDNLSKREYHHLFPHAYLKRNNLKDDQINLSLNCAVISWQTNRNISDKTPELYLDERLQNTSLAKGELQKRLESNIIPYDEMIDGNYDIFLKSRANLIHKKMNELCNIDDLF